MPHIGREAAVVSRVQSTGASIWYPVCGDWSCDDDEDWQIVWNREEDYAAIKRESEIAHFHEPRNQWQDRLEEVRRELSGGDPLWWGRPAGVVTPKSMQCKDISDEVFLGIVARHQARTGRWMLRGEVEDFTGWHWKIIVAKARKLILRGLLDGCYCGCRGDFEITIKGRKLIK